jgi:hypothetical protein
MSRARKPDIASGKRYQDFMFTRMRQLVDPSSNEISSRNARRLSKKFQKKLESR